MRGWHVTALTMMGCLLAFTAWRQFIVDPIPSAGSNMVWFGLQIAPLLLVLPGVVKRQANALFFATVVSFLYFIHGTLHVVEVATRASGSVEILLALAFFVALCMVMQKQKAASE